MDTLIEKEDVTLSRPQVFLFLQLSGDPFKSSFPSGIHFNQKRMWK